MNKKLIIISIIIVLLDSMIAISDDIQKDYFHSKGNVLYVGGTGVGNYSSIQIAINDAIDGDTVYVFNGTYYENILMNKTIALEGQNKSNTIIDGKNDDVIYVTTDDVVIAGFTIQNGHFGIRLFESWGNTINDNFIINNSLGIAMHTGSCNIFGNTVTESSTGISISYSSDNVITGNIVQNCFTGINFGTSSDNMINKNIIINCQYGINFGNPCDYNVIAENLINNNYVGIEIFDSKYNTINGNNITDSNWWGIFLDYLSDNNIIYNNYFDNTDNYRDLGYNNIWNITKTSGINIIGGPFIGGNYWNNYFGNDTNDDGIGDTIIPHGPGDYLPLVDYNYPPIADFTYSPILPNVDELVQFNSTSFDPDGSIVNYTWYFGDSISYEINPTYQYGDNGIYPMMLEVTDNEGKVDTVAKMVPVDFQMMPISTVTTGWNFISAPYNYSQDTHEFLIKHGEYYYNWTHATTAINPTKNPLINQYLFGWNRSIQTYTFERNLEPGYGYWMYSYQPCELWNQYDPIPPDTYVTNIQLGWNIISIPDNQLVNKTDLLVNNVDWNAAVGNGWVSDFVFGWNEIGQSYVFSDIFEHGQAYWLYAYQDCVMKQNS